LLKYFDEIHSFTIQDVQHRPNIQVSGGEKWHFFKYLAKNINEMSILIITTEEQIKALKVEAVKQEIENQPKKEEP